MKEAQLIKMARAALEADGWHTWRPAKVKFSESDIFGIFDVLAVKRHTGFYAAPVMWVQVTTYPNANARVHKIMHFFAEHENWIQNSWVWAWSENKNEWFKVRVYNPDAIENQRI